MSEGESSALLQMAVYALVMLLLVFGTVVLWKYVFVYLLLILPLVFFPFQEEWDEYRKQKRIRKMTKE